MQHNKETIIFFLSSYHYHDYNLLAILIPASLPVDQDEVRL